MSRQNIHVNPGNVNLNQQEQTAATAPPIFCSYLPDPLSAVAVLTLNRPDARNALGPLDWELIGHQLATIAAEERVRVLIIRGSGPTFSAGIDLRSLPEQLERPPHELQQQLYDQGKVVRMLYELDQPVIAQIHGPCTGSGLALALACDLRLCGASASLGVPAHRIGLTADCGLLWLLPRVVGPARATELLLLSDILPAARAEALGLVHRVVADDKLNEEVLALAGRLVAGPRLAQTLSKRGLHRSLGADFPTMIEWEAQAQSILARTEDAREGLRSLNEKRKPQFKGR
jgi:2-(1,2-epoxy-1,2-dihydrophenyl)acetyl-CoA isomerase